MKIDFGKCFVLALLINIAHIAISLLLTNIRNGIEIWFILTPLIFFGGMMFGMRNTSEFGSGLQLGLIFSIVGFFGSFFHLFFSMVFFGYLDVGFIGWFMICVLSLVLIGGIIGISNSWKNDDITNKIKIDFMHVFYALVLSVVTIFLSWYFIIVVNYSNGRALWIFTIPTIIIGGIYYFFRNTKGFINGLLNGLIFYVITNAVFYFSYEYFFKSINDLPFYIDPKFVMIATIGLVLLTGIIGWINSLEKEVDFFEFLSKASVSEEIVTKEREDINEN